MAAEPVIFCEQITFNLVIKNTVEPQPPKRFTVSTTNGQTLLQAMQAYQKTNGFSFQTKDIRGCLYLYVVEVMGERNAPDKFWETLLYDETTRDVKPISLSYKVSNGDNVYLRFSFF